MAPSRQNAGARRSRCLMVAIASEGCIYRFSVDHDPVLPVTTWTTEQYVDALYIYRYLLRYKVTGRLSGGIQVWMEQRLALIEIEI